MVRAEKRILIVTLFFPPDLSAGSFRAAALVDALLASPDVSVDVITAMPNRYSSFSSEAPEEEQRGRLSISRIRLAPHHGRMLDQIRAFLQFAGAAVRRIRGRRYDLVFGTSSRLMTATLAAHLARRLRTPLYLDIRDIFVDTLREILPAPAARPLQPLFSLVERWTIGRATRVNLVSKGFANYFEVRYPGRTFSYFTNGIDEEFLRPALGGSRPAGGPVLVMCAGNMGQGQGLERIVPGLAHRLAHRVRFKLIGDGGRRAELERELGKHAVDNVELVPAMARATLVNEYRAADVLFLHLNDYAAFTRVLPSKLFEYAALGKPIWAGVAGYAAEFVRAEVSNAEVFAPCDLEGALAAFDRLEIRDAPREEFVRKYRRTDIMRDMAVEILSFAAPK